VADFPSFQTLFRIARNEALIRNPQLTQTAIERDGSDANILVASACAAADEVVGQLIQVTTGLYLDSAEGAQLDRLLLDRYGLTRKVASSAVGSVTFTTTAPAASAFVIPANTMLSTPDGIQFQTVEAETFPAGSTGPIYCVVRSVLSGANQQIGAGTLTNIVGPIPSAPTDLVVTNPVATAGASDEESDDSFRARGRAFFSTARRGTLRAIEQGALTVAGVVKATAFETLDQEGRPAKLVSLAISDQYTDTLANLGVASPSYQAQSLVLAQSVFNALQEYRPAGIFVQVQVAQVVLQPIQLALSFTAGVNVDQVAMSARSAIVSVVNNLAPGTDLTVATLQLALGGVSGLVLTGNEIVSPAGTIVANPVQVIRTSLALVSATSSSPGTPIGSFTNPDQVAGA
jgi:uncharacterized phage protein gp47/JayE